MNPYGGHWEGDWGHWEGTGRHRSHMGPYWSILVHTGRLMLVPPPVAVVSIEDPFDQDDWEAWKRFVSHVDIQVVGEDTILVNYQERVRVRRKRGLMSILFGDE